MRYVVAAAAMLLVNIAFAQTNGRPVQDSIAIVNSSPDTIPLRQPDGSELHIIGFGNIFINYTETIDGYTIVMDRNGIYNFAVQTNDGDLKPSGVIAIDPNLRSKKLAKRLKTLPKHLRYSGEILKQLEEKQNGFVKKILPTEPSNK